MPTASRAPISEFVTSSDGTAIAYTRSGTGPAIVIVSGILNDRRKLQGLAQALSMDFTVFHFDRRGRGESADCETYSIAREIDDIAALIEAAGGSATVYGHSSGAGLAAHAASTGCRSHPWCCMSRPMARTMPKAERATRLLRHRSPGSSTPGSTPKPSKRS